jgi:hypothetical protein
MAPASWTTPSERKLLGSYIPLYLTRQAEKKLHKFWPIVGEAFLQDYPEEARLGFNKATATPEQWTALKDAIEARKRVSRTFWLEVYVACLTMALLPADRDLVPLPEEEDCFDPCSASQVRKFPR